MLLRALVALWLSALLVAAEIFCRKCGHQVASETLPSHKVPPAVERAQVRVEDGVKVIAVTSPRGANHELVCVPKATVRVSGASARSMADTFFPGYGWRPVECPICGAHLGWHFDRGTNCRPEDEPPSHENAAVAMRKIGRYCLSKSMGYWVVEWCNRDKVVQYHVEHNMRKPEYSLGSFVEAIAAVDGDLDDFAKLPGVPGRRMYHLQRFDGGQRCDETHGPRATRVIAVCCRDSASAVGDFSIADFKETSVCQYSMTICVPDLCRVKGFSPVLANQEECRAVPPGSVDAFVALDVESTVADPSTELKWAEGIKPVVGVIPT